MVQFKIEETNSIVNVLGDDQEITKEMINNSIKFVLKSSVTVFNNHPESYSEKWKNNLYKMFYVEKREALKKKMTRYYITNQDLETYELSKMALQTNADINMMFDSWRCYSYEEYLMIKQNPLYSILNLPKGLPLMASAKNLQVPVVDIHEQNETKLFVITTRTGTDGSLALYNKKPLMDLSDRLGDLYVMPCFNDYILCISKSSIIKLKGDEKLAQEEIIDSMIDLCSNDVKNIFSCDLYLYSKSDQKIELCK